MAIRKYYLLMLLGMAANMLVVNEVKAMEQSQYYQGQYPQGQYSQPQYSKQGQLAPEEVMKPFPYYHMLVLNGNLVLWENTVNCVIGALFTLANGYFNFYKYKESFYFDWWCGGWNSGRFANGYLQFCPNLNFVRFAFWLIAKYTKSKIIDKCTNVLAEAGVFKTDVFNNSEDIYIDFNKGYRTYYVEYTYLMIIRALGINDDNTKFFLFNSVQDIVSLPLIIHFTPTFKISIAIDSLIWMVLSYLMPKKEYIDEWGKKREGFALMFFEEESTTPGK